jgi:branched-chain amino acid transport system substrate-binding protein
MKVKGYDVHGLEGPVDFSDPVDKRGSKSLKIYQIKGAAIVSVTDWVAAPLIKYEDFDWFSK